MILNMPVCPIKADEFWDVTLETMVSDLVIPNSNDPDGYGYQDYENGDMFSIWDSFGEADFIRLEEEIRCIAYSGAKYIFPIGEDGVISSLRYEGAANAFLQHTVMPKLYVLPEHFGEIVVLESTLQDGGWAQGEPISWDDYVLGCNEEGISTPPTLIHLAYGQMVQRFEDCDFGEFLQNRKALMKLISVVEAEIRRHFFFKEASLKINRQRWAARRGGDLSRQKK